MRSAERRTKVRGAPVFPRPTRENGAPLSSTRRRRNGVLAARRRGEGATPARSNCSRAGRGFMANRVQLCVRLRSEGTDAFSVRPGIRGVLPPVHANATWTSRGRGRSGSCFSEPGSARARSGCAGPIAELPRERRAPRDPSAEAALRSVSRRPGPDKRSRRTLSTRERRSRLDARASTGVFLDASAA